MKKDLPPPPPPPQTRSEDRPVAPSQPFDVVVVVIAVVTLIGILAFLFTRENKAYVVDKVIHLDPVPAAADAPAPSGKPAGRPAASATSAIPSSGEAPKVGDVFEGTPEKTSTAKDRWGIPWMRVNGRVVFIRGAEVGKHTRFRITESQPSSRGDGDSIFFAQAIPEGGADSAPVPAPAVAPAVEPAAPAAAPSVEGPLAAGDVYEGTPTLVGKGKDTNGIPRMKVKDCMVYIRGAVVGEKTRFRIVESRRSSYDNEHPFYFAEAVSADTPLTGPSGKESAP